MKYFVAIAGREIEVVVDGDQVTIDGQMMRSHLGPVPGTPLRHLLLDGQSLTVSVESGQRGHWSLGFRGDAVEVEVVDERARHIRGLTAAAGVRSGGGVLKAPMPGLVVRVQVETGQRIGAGTGLVVLEAMKMENELRAASAGVIRTIHVQPGQAVEKGQVLLEFGE
ncbi:MAG: biotin/lipoyl-containing protein [Gemmatimonadota bacterium]